MDLEEMKGRSKTTTQVAQPQEERSRGIRMDVEKASGDDLGHTI